MTGLRIIRHVGAHLGPQDLHQRHVFTVERLLVLFFYQKRDVGPRLLDIVVVRVAVLVGPDGVHQTTIVGGIILAAGQPGLAIADLRFVRVEDVEADRTALGGNRLLLELGRRIFPHSVSVRYCVISCIGKNYSESYS